MRWFSRSQSEPEPVRADQVDRLAKRIADADDAVTFPGCPPELDQRFERAQSTLAATERNSSPAEIRAAYRTSREG